MTEPNTSAPDFLGQGMSVILGAFAVLSGAGVPPLVSFMLSAAVVVVIAALRR